jgi:hypothetical protein
MWEIRKHPVEIFYKAPGLFYAVANNLHRGKKGDGLDTLK